MTEPNTLPMREQEPTMTTYSEQDDLTEVLVGHRIISAEILQHEPDGLRWEGRGYAPYGRLTLDDGTIIYAVGNDGCSCMSGTYELKTLAAVDNVITSVHTLSNPDTKYGDDGPGRYSIFVVAGNQQLNIAEFEGSDGNGYYGTGFRLTVTDRSGS